MSGPDGIDLSKTDERPVRGPQVGEAVRGTSAGVAGVAGEPRLGEEMCHLAISRMALSRVQQDYGTELTEAQGTLNFLTASLGKPAGTFDSYHLSLAQRTFKLPLFLPGTQSAEFFVLFVSDAKSHKFSVEDIEFISGSQKIKEEANQLRSIDFNLPSPSDAPVRFVWRGTLGCYQYTGCSFVVLDPTTVNSIN